MKNKSISDLFRLLPVVLCTSVIFLLVGVHSYSMPLSQFTFLSAKDDTVLYDFFSYFKALTIVVTAVMSLLLMAYYLITGRRHLVRSYLYIPVCLYGFFIILSCIFSEYRYFALWGSPDRFEGTIVHLSYLVVMLYAFNCIDDQIELKFIIDTMFASTFIACIIGLTQFLGCDILTMSDRSLSSTQGIVYQTVYNPNYVGFYMCLVLPVLVSRILDTIEALKRDSAKPQTKFYLAGLLLLLILAGINIAGASSAGSIPGILFGVLLVCILRFGGKYMKISISALTVLFVGIAIATIFGAFGSKYSLLAKDQSDRPQIEYIKTYGSTIEIIINDNLLLTEYDPATGVYSLTDDAGKNLTVFKLPDSDLRYQFDDERFNGVIAFTPLIYEGVPYAVFETKEAMWRFDYSEPDVKYINDLGMKEKLDIVEHACIIKNYRFGSGRGYIWDTTLPLIRDHLFLGSGADTFMMIFPQDDYAIRYSHGLTKDTVYDKPHNMYLQIFIGFGLTGFLSFMAILISAFLTQKRKNIVIIDKTIMAVFCAIVAFLISALLNDSSVSVMPMFYAFLGCSCAIREI